jgi:hypothetical protein
MRRRRREDGGAPVNVERVSRVMKAQGLLLERHCGSGRNSDGNPTTRLPHASGVAGTGTQSCTAQGISFTPAS